MIPVVVRAVVSFSTVLSSAIVSVPTGDGDLMEYVGFYELDYRHPVVVSFRLAPGDRPTLLLSDLKTDAFRALFPAGDDRFYFGPSLIEPEPVAGELHFERSDDGSVGGLTLTRRDRAAVSGERVPIDTEAVRFERAGVQLEGTMFLPPPGTIGDGPGRAPGIVLAHGSEGEGRRSDFDALPWVGARLGFVVLAYDKRGTGASGGSWQVGLEVMAADLAAGLGILRGHARVDPNRVGIIGVSEGGWVAPLVARMDGDVELIVALSGGGMTKGDTFLQKHELRFHEQGLAGTALEDAMAEKRAIVATSRQRALAGTGDGFDLRISYDPDSDWRSFDGSVLAIMGEADVLQDTPACANWLRATLAESKSRDWDVKVFPRAHHNMFLAREGGTQEFQGLRWSQWVPGYWPTLLRWLGDRR